MRGQSSNSGAQQAHDRFASILSYYENHVPAGEIREFMKKSIIKRNHNRSEEGWNPSAEHGEELKKVLNDALKIRDAI